MLTLIDLSSYVMANMLASSAPDCKFKSLVRSNQRL